MGRNNGTAYGKKQELAKVEQSLHLSLVQLFRSKKSEIRKKKKDIVFVIKIKETITLGLVLSPSTRAMWCND